MTFNEFMTWLAYGGGAIWLVSWGLEQVKQFQALESNQKRWLIFALSSVISVVALWVVNSAPPETLALITPYVEGILLVFGGVFLSQVAHKADPFKK